MNIKESSMLLRTFLMPKVSKKWSTNKEMRGTFYPRYTAANTVASAERWRHKLWSAPYNGMLTWAPKSCSLTMETTYLSLLDLVSLLYCYFCYHTCILLPSRVSASLTFYTFCAMRGRSETTFAYCWPARAWPSVALAGSKQKWYK